MIRALVDTNVLVDFLARREPFYDSARHLLAACDMGDCELWMSSSQVTDLFYILSNGGRHSEADIAKSAILGLRSIVRIAAPGEREVDAALASPWADFEDALVCQTAIKIKAQAIVTRNIKDFSQSPIPIFDATDFLEYLASTDGIAR